jgi:uncharacterized RDD family membrane protein YckC
MKTITRGRVFDPHESARADALAGVPLASFGRRFAAFAIDFVLAGVTYVPLEILRQYIVLKLKHAEPDIHVHFDFHNPGSLIWMVLYFGCSVWWTNGRTLGKRLMRIRVVSLVHPKITLWQAVERALGYGASMLEGGFGFFQYFLHHNRCCVHDRIAETIVIQEQKQADSG